MLLGGKFATGRAVQSRVGRRTFQGDQQPLSKRETVLNAYNQSLRAFLCLTALRLLRCEAWQVATGREVRAARAKVNQGPPVYWPDMVSDLCKCIQQYININNTCSMHLEPWSGSGGWAGLG